MEFENKSEKSGEVADLQEDVKTLESENNQEVAEPEDKESENNQEIADPERDYERDRAFAELRRENQELKRQKELSSKALSMHFGEETPEIVAIAEANGMSPEEVVEILRVQEEVESIKRENEELKAKEIEREIEIAMKEDLTKIQKLDSSIKNLEELGEDFLTFIGAGLSAEDAYFACKQKQDKTSYKPPEEVGSLSQGKGQKDFYTFEEVENMTEEEINKNYDVIMKSQAKWK